MTLLKNLSIKDINISLLSLEAEINKLANFINVDDIRQQLNELLVRVDDLENDTDVAELAEEIERLKRQISSLQTELNTEKNNRQAADNILQSNINAEANTREEADNNLQAEIDTKVSKVDGKGLSTNDFTDADKTKLDGIETGANKTIVDSALSSTSTNPVQNKAVQTAITDIKKDQGYLCKLYSEIASSTSDSTSGSYNVMLLGKIPDPASTAAPATPSTSWDIDIDVYFVRAAGHKAAWCNVKAGYGYSNYWRKYGKIETFGVDSGSNDTKPFELVTLKYNNEWYIGVKHFIDIDGNYSARINNANTAGNRNPSTVANTLLSNVLKVIPYKKANNTVLNSEINSSLAEFPDTYAPTIRKNGRQIINGLNIKSTTDTALNTFGIEPLSIGISTGVNLGIDNNEIQARNNGTASILNLNNLGGETHIGTAGIFSSNGLEYNGTSANTVTDTALSSTSTKPVQNKVINTALANKVDKVSGKGLSTNDFTDALKTKLENLNGNVVVDSALSSTSTNPVQNKVINAALSAYSKLQLTSLWSGRTNSSGYTITFPQPYTNFKFIIVEGSMYGGPDCQRMYAVIPSSQCSQNNSSSGLEEFLICGSTADTDRRIRFSFPTTTTLRTYGSVGTTGNLPVLTNVWGLK